jgi:hypothetical protein
MRQDTILKNWNEYLAGEVRTDTKVKPTAIDVESYGHHISYVSDKVRIWRFKEPRGYFKFLGEYYDHMVKSF